MRFHWIARTVVTLVATVFLALNLFDPNVRVSYVSILLIVVAALPWFTDIIKTISLPGGSSIEFREFERAEAAARNANLIQPPNQTKDEPAYLSVADRDPILALAGLRIEIERRLRGLAPDVDQRSSLYRLFRYLTEQHILSSAQYSVLSDLIGMLNRAAHGEQVPQEAAEWAMTVGPELLAGLDNLVS